MPDPVKLFSECHADTALVLYLVKDETLVNHSAGINEVAKAMQVGIRSADTVIGIVDNDKHKPRYFDVFEKIQERSKTHLLKKPDSREFLVLIDKAIETFLLWNAVQVAIDLIDYGFPTEIRQLGLALKRRSIETDPDYRRLLTDLHIRRAPGVMTLDAILNDFLPH